MTKHTQARLRINKLPQTKINIFHCELKICCNFISSISDRNRKYCPSHMYGLPARYSLKEKFLYLTKQGQPYNRTKP